MRLLKDQVKDTFIQENFRRVENDFNDEGLLRGKFKFFDVTFSTTGSYPFTTNYVHNLPFVPLDVISTRVTGGTITWNYTSFTSVFINVTVSAATRVRFYLGRYEETNV